MDEVIRFIKKSDVQLYFWLNHKFHFRILSITLMLITQLGSTAFSISLCLYLLFQSQVEIYMSGWFLIATLINSQLLVHSLKRLVNRPRPYDILEEVNAKNPPKCRYSFPSGHTNAAFCIAIVLSMSYPYYSFTFFVLAILVGISRVCLGYHYPTDVLIGAFISFISFFIINNLMSPLV